MLGSNSKAYCWGENDYGQLGNNSTTDARTPVAVQQRQIPVGIKLTQISVSGMHTCALGSNGKAYCWGNNQYGKLGNNSETGSLTPVAVHQGQIPNNIILTQIVTSWTHTCALDSNGKAYCWGYNENGRLGNNSATNALTPVAVHQGQIPTGVVLNKLSATGSHTCALGSDAKAYCWGDNTKGQLGNNYHLDAFTPVAVHQGQISSSVSLTQVVAGFRHTCALGSDAKAYCWGNNDYGELGNGSSATYSRTPVAVQQGQIPTGAFPSQIIAGGFHTCALGSDSKAYCWGNNNYGQLGNNSTLYAAVPSAVHQGQFPVGVALTQVAVAGSHTCALGSDSKAYCWGLNNQGQIGDNTHTTVLSPVAVHQGQISSGSGETQVKVDNTPVPVKYISPYELEIAMPAHSYVDKQQQVLHAVSNATAEMPSIALAGLHGTRHQHQHRHTTRWKSVV